MKKAYKITALCAAAVLAVAGLAGCGKEEQASTSQKTLDYWVPISGAAASLVDNLDKTPLYQKLQEVTGIDLNFIHPSGGSLAEKFNILMASNDFPDMIQYNWLNYPGGPQKAIDEGVIIDIYQYKDMAPNLINYLDSNEDVKRLAVTNEGALFSFPFVRGDDSLCVSWGMTLRKDWLDELNLEVPETIDEWEIVLRAFKEKKGATAPLTITTGAFENSQFVGAYNTTMGYYIGDNKVKYGLLEPGFKDFLMLMNRWYSEGLLDNNFALLDNTTIDANILNGTSGAAGLSLGNGIGRYMSSAPDDRFDLIGAPSPVLNKGDVPEFGYLQTAVPPMTNSFTVICADSEKIETAMEFLDFGYSEEGHMIYNFGIEGESYNMVDGYPKYTDKITKNEEGHSMNIMLSQYTESYASGAFVQDKRYMEQYASLPQQLSAWDTWTKTNMKEHVLPNLYVAEGKQNELAILDNSINTYATEIITKFIVGTMSFDEYDNAIAELKQRGIERSLEIRNEAYQSYLTK